MNKAKGHKNYYIKVKDRKEAKYGRIFKVDDQSNDIEYYASCLATYGIGFEETMQLLRDSKNPLKEYINFGEDPGKDLLRLLRDPDYFPFAAKYFFGINVLPFQALWLKVMFEHPFPLVIACRGGSKTFTIALYIILMLLLYQGTKVIMVGVGFRQSRLIFEYMEKMYNSSPILKDLIGNDPSSGIKKYNDRWTMTIGRSEASAIPIGDGKKIRGFRANIVIADEFQSQNPQIYEEVIQGFGATSSDPYQNVVDSAKRRFLKERGLWTPEQEEVHKFAKRPNQSIILGTADYDFGHFSKYFKKYTDIINTEGDPEKLESIFGRGQVEENFNWEHYAVIRVPYYLFPEGFMDMVNISRSKLSLPENLFGNEYNAVFSKDSNGFFKMSLIHSCTCNEPIQLPSGPVQFNPMLKGTHGCKYVMGIDPAMSQDNLALVVLEVHPDHRRVVYCWTTNLKKHKEQVTKGLVEENEYNSYVARKIRTLMQKFDIELISMDSQGGGKSILEALHDKDKLKVGEVPIWEINKDHIFGTAKEKPEDDMPGKHIVEMVQFGQSEYMTMSNNAMRKDLEDKAILFPYVDPITMSVACEDDNLNKREFDTLEECSIEIQEIKTELASIVVTRTEKTGKEHWDTPETKTPDMKKGRMKKDRYSAIIMANYAARRLTRFNEPKNDLAIGGILGHMSEKSKGGEMYSSCPDWFRGAAIPTIYKR